LAGGERSDGVDASSCRSGWFGLWEKRWGSIDGAGAQIGAFQVRGSPWVRGLAGGALAARPSRSGESDVRAWPWRLGTAEEHRRLRAAPHFRWFLTWWVLLDPYARESPLTILTWWVTHIRSYLIWWVLLVGGTRYLYLYLLLLFLSDMWYSITSLILM
jgi:hypothetical protein